MVRANGNSRLWFRIPEWLNKYAALHIWFRTKNATNYLPPLHSATSKKTLSITSRWKDRRTEIPASKRAKRSKHPRIPRLQPPAAFVGVRGAPGEDKTCVGRRTVLGVFSGPSNVASIPSKVMESHWRNWRGLKESYFIQLYRRYSMQQCFLLAARGGFKVICKSLVQ